MGNSIIEVRRYVAEMLSATRQLLGAVAVQLRAPETAANQEVRWLLERLTRTLNAHVDELAEHLQRLGGGALVDDEENAARTQRFEPQPVDRALRGYYTALSVAHAGALMMETNSRALGYSSTAALATRHREEISTMLARIREAIPLQQTA